MSGDYSRITFDPWQDDLGVLLQQGRPLSDAEWNALTLQLRRRIHAGTLDTIGTAVVPMQTQDGFKPTLAAGKLFIGQGRLYVDGLLAENHGADPKAWNPRLEELVGTQPVNYESQPYYPGRPDLPVGGPHLVYLDVWQREVTHIVRPDLVEKAVGVDSTTHLQTVWQVKLLNNVGTPTNCSTPLDSIPGWTAANAPSAGRLSIDTASVPGEPDPCLIPPGGGYKGLENQLYRIEIHTPGAPGTATFKWSRENASIETRITHMPSLSQLRVESVGKDSVLRFSDGDWVEITDDFLELSNQPGQLRRIKVGGGVDDATRTIVLDKPLNAGVFPVDAQDRTQPGRHMRIKRWDHHGKVRDKNGNDLQDLDLDASTGEILVPAAAGVSVLLEHGIIATFSLDPAGGKFRSGDYWVVAARTSDASIEVLDKAPPRGIHHHSAKLGIVTFPGSISDCRIFWPPPVVDTGGGDKVDTCACTICVTPEQHASGAMTVQKAIDEVRSRGGGTVCLDIGTYVFDETLAIDGAKSLRLTGKGPGTHLVSKTGVIRITKSDGVTLDSFSVICETGDPDVEAAIGVASSRDVLIETLRISVSASENSTIAGIALRDALLNVSIRDNSITAPVGLASVGREGGETGLTNLRVDDNLFDCVQAGIDFSGVTVYQFLNRLHGNHVLRCRKAGFAIAGLQAPGHGLEIAGNSLDVVGDGIVSGINGVRIVDNDVVQSREADPKDQAGILLAPSLRPALSSCHVGGNRVSGFNGAGIAVRSSTLQSATFSENRVEACQRGLEFKVEKLMAQVTVADNHFSVADGPAILGGGESASYVISGNHATSRSIPPIVVMDFPGGNGNFSHNETRCERGGDFADVRLRADTLEVANNRITGGGISIDVLAKARRFTVLGNICGGVIRVEAGAPLPAPWTPLNIQNA